MKLRNQLLTTSLYASCYHNFCNSTVTWRRESLTLLETQKPYYQFCTSQNCYHDISSCLAIGSYLSLITDGVTFQFCYFLGNIRSFCVYWLKKGRQNCNTRIVINFEVCINVNFLNQLNQKNTHRFSRTFKFQSLCKQKLPILDMFSQNFIFLLWFLWQLFTFPNCQIDIKSQPSYSLQMLGKMKYVNRKNLYF